MSILSADEEVDFIREVGRKSTNNMSTTISVVGCESGFPDDSEVGDMRKLFDSVVGLGEIKKNIWYKVLDQYNVNTRYGPSTIILIQERNNCVISTWITNIITKSLVESRERIKGDETIYFKYKGLRSSKKIGAGNYHDFELKNH